MRKSNLNHDNSFLAIAVQNDLFVAFKMLTEPEGVYILMGCMTVLL